MFYFEFIKIIVSAEEVTFTVLVLILGIRIN